MNNETGNDFLRRFGVYPGRTLAIAEKPFPFDSTRSSVGYEETFVKTPPAPKFVISGMLLQAPFGFTGTGGTIKTTLMLYVMIHVVLGRTLVRPGSLVGAIEKPGPCVLVTQEDGIDIMRWRLRKICDALMLSTAERKKVAQDLHIVDVTGEIMRLVVEEGGNLVRSIHVDAFVDAYLSVKASIVTFDPASYFGPGERHVNDGDAALMQASARISKGLECAAGYIAHVSKEQARAGGIDQHSKRGGSAFGDNARTIWGIATHKVNFDSQFPRPDIFKNRPAESLLRLEVPKLSYGQRPTNALYISRSSADAWHLELAWSIDRTSDEARADALRKTMQDLEKKLRHLHAELTAFRGKGQFNTKTSLYGRWIMDGDIVPKGVIGTVVGTGLACNVFAMEEVPKSARQGGLKHHIVAADLEAGLEALRSDPPERIRRKF